MDANLPRALGFSRAWRKLFRTMLDTIIFLVGALFFAICVVAGALLIGGIFIWGAVSIWRESLKKSKEVEPISRGGCHG